MSYVIIINDVCMFQEISIPTPRRAGDGLLTRIFGISKGRGVSQARIFKGTHE